MDYHRIDAWHPGKPAAAFAPRPRALRRADPARMCDGVQLHDGTRLVASTHRETHTTSSSSTSPSAPASADAPHDAAYRPATLASPSRLTPVAPAHGWARPPLLLAWLTRSRWTVRLAALAFVLAWLLPGTLGHDPWKQDETYTFGIIQHMLESGDLVVPMNAGQPFVEKPPLYDWVAAGLAWMFGRYLPLHDAARLASALFAALTLACTARLVRRATGAASWLDMRVLGGAALFAGSLVVVKHAHDMMTDVALMAGAALGFCGLYELVEAHLRGLAAGSRATVAALDPRDEAAAKSAAFGRLDGVAAKTAARDPLGEAATTTAARGSLDEATATPATPDACDEAAAMSTAASAARQATEADLAALMFGAGVGIALMTKGLFVPLVFAATTAAVFVCYPRCRSRAFGRSLALAALACAPFALIWPLCFFLRSEALFKVWFWDNNVGRFFGFSVPELGSGNEGHLFAVRSLMSVGFPVSPLALVALIATLAPARSRADLWRRFSAPRILLPTLFAGIGVTVLQMSATVRELYVLPFIAPLAVLAALGVPRLPQRAHTGWDLASRALFGALAALAWVIWSIATLPAASHGPLRPLGRWLPLDWVMPVHPVLVLAALALTFGWLWLLPTLRHAGIWRGALSWCAGAVVAWGLVSTLLLPWLDVAKSYRSVFDDLGHRLAIEWNDGDCMASIGLGESEAPMLYYFTGVLHQPVRHAADTSCTWLIVGSRRDDAPSPGGGWQLYWSGARPGDTDELLRVFVRTPERVPAAQ